MPPDTDVKQEIMGFLEFMSNVVLTLMGVLRVVQWSDPSQTTVHDAAVRVFLLS